MTGEVFPLSLPEFVPAVKLTFLSRPSIFNLQNEIKTCLHINDNYFGIKLYSIINFLK